MRRSSEWIHSCSDDPFFLYIHNFDPHAPYMAPEPYLFGTEPRGEFQKFKSWLVFGSRIPYIYKLHLQAIKPLTESEAQELRQRYLGEVEYVDASIYLIEKTLKEIGIWDDTLLIITSDHGEEFQEHGTLRHGNNLYFETIRVPLIFTGGVFKGESKKVESPVSLLDLYPTILEHYGMPVPQDCMGQSLWPLIEGKTGGPRIIFSEMLQMIGRGYRLMSVVKDDCHFIKRVPYDEEISVKLELYNYVTDPQEQNDLCSREPGKCREMEQVLDSFYNSIPEKNLPDKTVDEVVKEIKKMMKVLGYIR